MKQQPLFEDGDKRYSASHACPSCCSSRIYRINRGRRVGGAVGTVAGATAGRSGAAAGAETSAVLGLMAGPAGAVIGSLAGAIFGVLLGASAGAHVCQIVYLKHQEVHGKFWNRLDTEPSIFIGEPELLGTL